MPWVYIVECSDTSFYTGNTWDLDARMFQHQAGGGAVYTSTRTPVTLRFCRETDSIREAYEWERRNPRVEPREKDRADRGAPQ